MTTQNEAITQLYPEIQAAARKVAAEWSDVTEADDLANDMVVHLLGGARPYVLTLAEFDKNARTKTLFKIGTRIAAQERDDYDYFHGNFRYSLEEVRQLLRDGALFHVGQSVAENHFNKRDEAGGATDPNPLGFKEPKVRDNVENLDVEVCFGSLTENQKRILVAKYYTESYDGHPQELARAEEALMHAMNRNFRTRKTNHDGPGSRQAISNAHAAVINKRQMEDG